MIDWSSLLVVGHALVGRQDLPIPAWLFAWAASLVLIVSFFGLSVAWHRAASRRPIGAPCAPGSPRCSSTGSTEVLAGAIGVFLLGVTIYSGLKGTEAPDRNFSVTFIFVTAWLGLVVLERAVRRRVPSLQPVAGDRPRGGRRLSSWWRASRRRPPFDYPERFGRWPAALGIVAFAWLELVYGQGGFQTVGLTPHTIAVAAIAYSIYTFVAMGLFGREAWLARGETFSVYFGMFSRLAGLEVREGTLGIRRMLSATTNWVAEAPGSIALVLISIGVTTFDGAGEGTLADPVRTVAGWFGDIGLGEVAATRISNSIFLAITLAFVAGLFWAGIYGMHTVRTRLSTQAPGRLFAHAFIPIALAYLSAHYFSLFVFQEQAQFTFLLSDPLGDGSDLFGTAASGIDYTTISSNAIWYVQVGALIAGHVCARSCSVTTAR